MIIFSYIKKKNPGIDEKVIEMCFYEMLAS